MSAFERSMPVAAAAAAAAGQRADRCRALFFAAFMFESSFMLPLTDYAMKRTGKLHGAYTFSCILSTSLFCVCARARR